MPRALPKALKSKTFATQGELRQVGLILSWATTLSQPRLGSLPTRRTLPSPVAAAAWECKAWWREVARRAALCSRTGPGAAGRIGSLSCQSHPAEPRSSPPTEPILRSRCRQHLSALAQSTTPAARSS